MKFHAEGSPQHEKSSDTVNAPTLSLQAIDFSSRTRSIEVDKEVSNTFFGNDVPEPPHVLKFDHVFGKESHFDLRRLLTVGSRGFAINFQLWNAAMQIQKLG